MLVVEDDADLREIVADTLRRDGYLVLSAASGEEACALLEPQVHLDLVLSDVRMPGTNGLAVGHRLRALRTTPLILMTAFPEAELDDAAAEIHATVIPKPFRLEVLRRTVLTTIAASMRH